MAENRDAFGNPIAPRSTSGVPGGPTVGGSSRPSESGLPATGSATTGVPQQYDAPRPASGPQGTNESFGKRGVSASTFGTLSIVILLVIIVGGVLAITSLGIFN